MTGPHPPSGEHEDQQLQALRRIMGRATHAAAQLRRERAAQLRAIDDFAREVLSLLSSAHPRHGLNVQLQFGRGFDPQAVPAAFELYMDTPGPSEALSSFQCTLRATPQGVRSDQTQHPNDPLDLALAAARHFERTLQPMRPEPRPAI